MNDLIDRQMAIDAINGYVNTVGVLDGYTDTQEVLRIVKRLPSAQPEPSEITDEQAIMHLQSTGWMQNHDREMYESGLRERLADDSDSYDALLPSAHPEPQYDEWCTDCKEYDHERHCCPRFNRVIHETLDDTQAERNTGKWIIDGHHIRCDQCGMAMCDTDREGDRIPRGFCPSCGVRMDNISDACMKGEEEE